MPEVKAYFLDTEKKIDLSRFYNGESAYITIKKLPRDIQSKIKYYEALTMQTRYSEIMSDYIGDLDTDDPDEMKNALSDPKLLKRVLKETQALPLEEIEKINKATNEIENMLLKYGIDKTAHNFTDAGQPIELDLEFWNNKAQLAEYLILEIKAFNAETLGKQNGQKLTLQ